MDHKRRSLREKWKIMQGLNPKLDLYKRLEEECSKLRKELEILGAERTKK